MSERIHHVTVWQDSKGLDFARCGGVEVSSRRSATADLARKLVAAGEPDGPVHVRGLDRRLRYTIGSLHDWATWTVAEPDKGRIKFTKWAPNPMFAARQTACGGVGR